MCGPPSPPLPVCYYIVEKKDEHHNEDVEDEAEDDNADDQNGMDLSTISTG